MSRLVTAGKGAFDKLKGGKPPEIVTTGVIPSL
jgi:hypothetical protein